jgi:uncharacterized protein with HEPN domain
MPNLSTRDNDLYRIGHMIQFSEQILSITDGLSEDDLEDDWIRMLALTRLFETLGEATTKVSKETKTVYPDIAWEGARRMRNRLIHGYDDIEYELVWNAILEDIPLLLSQLRKLKEELSVT